MPDIPPGPTECLILLLEVDPEDIHFVDNIIKSHDNIAQVRRNYRIYQGRPCYEMLVPPDFLEEVDEVIERLGCFLPVGRVTLTNEGVDSVGA